MIRQGKSFSGHERNCVYLNTRHGSFSDASGISGLDYADDSRALATVDWDLDGDLDVVTTNRSSPRVRMLRNDLPAGKHFIAFRLVGNGRDTNRDAIGARVELVIDESKNRQPPSSIMTALGGEGFLSQSSRWLHFGLGEAADIKEVIVHWPTANEDAKLEHFSTVKIDRHYELLQGSGTPKRIDQPNVERAVSPGALELPPASGHGAVRMLAPVSMPQLHYTDTRYQSQMAKFSNGRFSLVNLWATWCEPCLIELNELTKQKDELAKHDITVLTLCVDHLQDETFDSATASSLLDRMNFPWEPGLATVDTAEILQPLHDDQVNAHRPLPVPVSFLVDTEGKLLAIYKGRVSVADLVRDVQFGTLDDDQRDQWASLMPGRVLSNDRLDRVRRIRKTNIEIHSAFQLHHWGRTEESERRLREVVAKHSDSAEAATNFAVVLMSLNKVAEAEKQFLAALQINPQLVQALNGQAAIHASRGELLMAAELLRRAVEIDGHYLTARRNLLRIQEKLRRRSDALSLSLEK